MYILVHFFLFHSSLDILNRTYELYSIIFVLFTYHLQYCFIQKVKLETIHLYSYDKLHCELKNNRLM